MYLQYHNNAYFVKKKKSNIIQTESLCKQKDATIQFFQKKVSSLDTKWRHIIHKLPESVPPTPPPKKSRTAPNLKIITDRDFLMNRELPSLPSIEKKNSISRASTWVGKSIQRWMSFVPLNEKDQSSTTVQERETLVRKPSNCLNRKMNLHCRILQVTNLTSAKNYDYTMHIYVTNNSTQIYTGRMKRVAKGLSASHPRAALLFNVEGRFQLEFDMSIKACSPNTIVDRLKSLRPYSADDESEIRGRLCLDSGEDPLSSFANKGIGRYAIQTSTSVTLELTLAFWLKDQREEQQFGNPIDQDISRYCESEDYLTFYKH